jgi:hypothetical protein
MVGGRIRCCPPQHEEPHRWYVVAWKRDRLWCIYETKIKYEKFHGGQACWRQRQFLWARYFLEAQGFTVNDSIINQDNQSSILVEKNGRGSSSKQTRHINIKYFFVADHVAAGEVKIQYCPIGDMLADFFTKPLQGSIFRKFRDFILNVQGDPDSTTHLDHRSVLRNHTKLSTSESDGSEPLKLQSIIKPETIIIRRARHSL